MSTRIICLIISQFLNTAGIQNLVHSFLRKENPAYKAHTACLVNCMNKNIPGCFRWTSFHNKYQNQTQYQKPDQSEHDGKKDF